MAWSPLLLLCLLSLTTQLCFSAENHPLKAGKPKNSDDLLRSCCSHTRYPSLCMQSLSSYASSAKSPNDLAQAALTVSVARAQRTSSFVSSLFKLKALNKRETGALKDCVEQLSDGLDELRRSLAELRHLRASTFRWQMGNVETWVSAALTNDDTCLNGFQNVESKVKVSVKGKISYVARVTSNALSLINRLEATQGHA